MTASELISLLQLRIYEHGDLPVYVIDDDAQGEVRRVDVEPSNKALTFTKGFVELPQRFIVDPG